MRSKPTKFGVKESWSCPPPCALCPKACTPKTTPELGNLREAPVGCLVGLVLGNPPTELWAHLVSLGLKLPASGQLPISTATSFRCSEMEGLENKGLGRAAFPHPKPLMTIFGGDLVRKF